VVDAYDLEHGLVLRHPLHERVGEILELLARPAAVPCLVADDEELIGCGLHEPHFLFPFALLHLLLAGNSSEENG